MDIKAAVAFEPGKPLRIETVDLEGPAPARCWSRSRPPASATPTRSRSRARTRRASSPPSSATRAPASWSTSAPGVHLAEEGRPRDPALHAGVPRSASTASSGKTNLCQAIRATQGKGLMPDGTSRFSLGGEPRPPLHGHVHLLELHGAAGDRAGEDPRGRARSTRSATSAAASPPASAPSSTPPRWSRAPTWSSSASAASASTWCRARGMVGADMIVGVDINPGRRAIAEKFGMTHFVNPKEVGGDLVPHLVEPHRGRRRLQLRVHRQRAA